MLEHLVSKVDSEDFKDLFSDKNDLIDSDYIYRV